MNLIFSAKTQANPESSVGLMSEYKHAEWSKVDCKLSKMLGMGGSQPEVLTTLTTDFGKVLDGLHRTKIRGVSHLSTALNVAGVRVKMAPYVIPTSLPHSLTSVLSQLALKHRQNKSQHQRIIVFTCSPLAEDEKTCIKLAKRMKKNTINVDLICFGDLDADTVKKLEAFHENIKGSADGSHIAIIPPGPNLLSDSIVATPILAGEGIGAGAAGAGGEEGGMGGGEASGFEFGVDPSADPELALALRMSMEEEERRRQREEREKAEKEGKSELESVPEGEESKGEASASAATTTTAPNAEEEGAGGEKKPESESKNGEPDPDKMDTA